MSSIPSTLRSTASWVAVAVSVPPLSAVATLESEPPTVMLSSGGRPEVPAALVRSVRRAAAGELPSSLTTPPTMEHTPSSGLLESTEVVASGMPLVMPESSPLAVVSTVLTGAGNELVPEPAVDVAAGMPEHRLLAEGSESPPMPERSSEFRLNVRAWAPTRLPVPSAVGLPLASSEAVALPQAGPRESSGAALTAGTAQLLEPEGLGEAEPPELFCTANWLLSSAKLPDVGRTGRAGIGRGRAGDAGAGAEGLGQVGAGGLGVRAAARDLHVVEQVERDEAAVGL